MLGDMIFPVVRPIIYVASLVRIVEDLNVLPLIYIMTCGGPAVGTENINYLAISKFSYFELSEASANSVIIFMTLSAFGLIFVSIMCRSDKQVYQGPI